MKIYLNDPQKLFSEQAVKEVEEKIQTLFTRFGFHVTSVSLTLNDVNGPKGGDDKECLVVVRLRGKLPDATVRIQDASASRATNLGLKRAQRSVTRTIERHLSRESDRSGSFGFAFYR